MSVVFYRKYRPQRFSEFIGQEYIIKTITNALSLGMISHAYLFSGPRGSGKTTLARLLAKAINCQNRKEKEFEPCNECFSCKEINEGRAIDIVEIDAASHRGIDEIRELKEGIKFSPTSAKYKVFIIDEAHQLTKEAANALLKTLEEPPPRVIFILATTEIQKMIPTIVSRCQRFDFRRLTAREIFQKLSYICQEEKIGIEKDALEIISLNAGGSFRDAESLLDQVISFTGKRKITAEDVKDILGLVETKILIEFLNFLIEKKEKEAISFINEIFEKGEDLEEFIKSLIEYLRQILVFKITQEKKTIEFKLTEEEITILTKQAQAFSLEGLVKTIEIFLDAQKKMRYNPIIQLPLEIAIIEACRI
jgi:DNA polymerase-3 subunit gamma/tau